MAVPVIELSALSETLQDIARAAASQLWNGYQKAKADGVPSEVAIQRLEDQIELENPNSPVLLAASRGSREVTNRLRNVYHTLNEDWSAGLAAMKADPKTFQFLPKIANQYLTLEEAGYRVSLDDLNRKIVRAASTAERPYPELDTLENQIRQEQRLRRSTVEQKQSIGQKSEGAKNNVMLVWIATFVKTCKDCLKLHGTMKTRLEWEQGGIKPGSGSTVCGFNCQCHLVPIRQLRSRLMLDEGMDDIDVRDELVRRTENGLQLQKERVEAMAKKRGKEYSEDYAQALQGQVQSARFNPYLESGSRTNIYLNKLPAKGVPKAFVEKIVVRK